MPDAVRPDDSFSGWKKFKSPLHALFASLLWLWPYFAIATLLVSEVSQMSFPAISTQMFETRYFILIPVAVIIDCLIHKSIGEFQQNPSTRRLVAKFTAGLVATFFLIFLAYFAVRADAPEIAKHTLVGLAVVGSIVKKTMMFTEDFEHHRDDGHSKIEVIK